MPEIRLSKLTKRYGAVEVLHGIDLEMAENEFTVLVGPSGCACRQDQRKLGACRVDRAHGRFFPSGPCRRSDRGSRAAAGLS